MFEITNAQAKEALKSVFDKASSDEAFRAKCLSEPKAAIKEAAGLDVPDDMEIKFIERGSADVGAGSAIVVTLPPPTGSEEVLEDEMLASMAGGVDGQIRSAPECQRGFW